MDKTLEIVVAAAVIVVIGAIAAYLVNSEASNFSEFLGGESDGAKCDLYQGSDRDKYMANDCHLEEQFQPDESGVYNCPSEPPCGQGCYEYTDRGGTHCLPE